jgi:hypothetical protein
MIDNIHGVKSIIIFIFYFISTIWKFAASFIINSLKLSQVMTILLISFKPLSQGPCHPTPNTPTMDINGLYGKRSKITEMQFRHLIDPAVKKNGCAGIERPSK